MAGELVTAREELTSRCHPRSACRCAVVNDAWVEVRCGEPGCDAVVGRYDFWNQKGVQRPRWIAGMALWSESGSTPDNAVNANTCSVCRSAVRPGSETEHERSCWPLAWQANGAEHMARDAGQIASTLRKHLGFGSVSLWFDSASAVGVAWDVKSDGQHYRSSLSLRPQNIDDLEDYARWLAYEWREQIRRTSARTREGGGK